MSRQIWYLTITVFFILIASMLICGTIPVGNGAGWDGAGYLRVIEDMGKGIFLKNDPYHVTRLPGFALLILFSIFGFKGDDLINIQIGVNIVLATSSVILIYHTLTILTSSRAKSIICALTLLFSWPLLVMPVYYPILSDHVALFVSCMSIWLWANHHQKSLYAITFYSLWIMPGLFVIPFILSAMPYRGILPQCAKTLITNKANLLGKVFLFLLLMAFFAKIAVSKFFEIPDESIVQQGKNLEGETALIGLKLLSGSLAFLLMAFLLWRAVSYLLTKSTWTSISVPKLIGALILLMVNALIMFKGLNWDTGFKGPPLLDFMTAQTLALPLKPIVAHFIGLGPAVLVVLATILFKPSSCRSTTSLEIIFISFTPLLIFGAESRQWIGVLPVAICLLGVYNWTTAQRVWCLIASALIVAPALLLKSQVTLATTQSLSFQSAAWQYYFNRQGPWMSVYSYEMALIALAIFIILFIYLPSTIKTLKAIGNSPT